MVFIDPLAALELHLPPSEGRTRQNLYLSPSTTLRITTTTTTTTTRPKPNGTSNPRSHFQETNRSPIYGDQFVRELLLWTRLRLAPGGP